MDGISAVASLIAIGQAIAALPKVVEALQSLVKFKAEVAYLINELESLRAVIHEITESVSILTASDASNRLAIQEPVLLKQCRRTLITIVPELEKLVNDCTKESSLLRSRRVKWVFKSKKIKALVAQTRETRQDMVQACQLLGLRISRAHGNILLEIVSMQAELPMIVKDFRRIEFQTTNHIYPRDPRHLIHDVPQRQVIAPIDNIPHPGEKIPQNGRVQDLEDGDVTDTETFVEEDASEEFVQFETSIAPSMICDASCRCQCHTKRNEYSSPTWVEPLIGSLFLNYGCLPIPRRWKCDVPDCSGSRSTVLMNYYFPRWLCYRAVSFSRSIDSITGQGSTLHLKIPRIIPHRYGRWEDIVFDKVLRLRQPYLDDYLLPSDQDEYGQSLLTTAIDARSYDAVEFMFKMWRLGRPGAECDRLSSLNARLLLERDDIDKIGSSMVSILQKISLLNEEPDSDDLELHRAIKAGDSIHDILEEMDPTEVNKSNVYGKTALHLACEEGDIEAVQLLIQAGASLNDRDFKGRTPLIVSVQSEEWDCAMDLIEAGCDLHVLDIDGESALSSSMTQDLTDSFDTLMSILSKINIPTNRGRYNRTPLHWLAFVREPEDLMEQAIHFMLERGADIHAQDVELDTPAMLSITQSNTVALRLLLKNGAILDTAKATEGRTFVHHAALFAKQDLLEYMTEIDLETTDVDATDEERDTPLDCWRWRTYHDERQLFSDMERPTAEEHPAFDNFLRKLRDQSLSADINVLTEALGAVRSEDGTAARAALKPLREQKLSWEKDVDAETLRVIIDVQIPGGMWSAAEEVLEEMIDIRRKRIALLPSEEKSNHFRPNDPYQYDTDEMDDSSLDEDDGEISGSDGGENDVYNMSDSET